MGVAGETIVITITGNSAEGVAAANAQAASLERIGVAAKQSTAASVTASKQMQRAGTSMIGVGKGLTKYVTLPLVGIGAASIALSRDFGSSMRLISTQAGGTRREMEHMKKAILDLVASGYVKQTPKELADALFHIESVGYRGAKAMKVLKASADLATLGQANMEDTTYALVSALETGIKGTENLRVAMGTLNAIVGAGDMRMQDLTESLSSGVLISANQVGLSLRDVGAALAMMTSRGMPAQVAATRLRMTFTLMAAPTSKAKDALKGIGIGAEDLAVAMRKPAGLLKALELLKGHLDGLSKVKQTAILSEAFGGARSGTTMMALLQNLDDVRQRYARIGATADDVNKKLREAKQAAGFKLSVAWSQLEGDLIRIGDQLLPVVVPAFHKLVDAVTSVTDAFDHLPAGTKTAIVEFGLVVAVVGPLLSLFGAMVRNIGVLVGWFGRMTGSSVAQTEANAALTTSYVELTAAINGSAAAAARYEATQSGLLVPPGMADAVGKDSAKKVAGGFAKTLGPALATYGIANIVTSATSNDWRDAGFEAGGALAGGVAGFMLGGPFGAMMGVGLGSLGGELASDLFGGLLGSTKKLTPLQRALQSTTEALAAAQRRQRGTAQAVTQSQDNLRNAQGRAKRAAHDLADAENHLEDVRSHHSRDTVAVLRAEAEVHAKHQANTRAAREQERAEDDLRFAQKARGRSIAEMVHTASLAVAADEKWVARVRKRVAAEGWSKTATEAARKATAKLAKDEATRNEALDQARQRNKAWAKSLEDMTTAQHRFGADGRALVKHIDALSEKLSSLRHNVAQTGGPMSPFLAEMHKTARELRASEGQLSRFVASTGAIGPAWHRASETVGQSGAKMQGATRDVSRAQDRLRGSAAQDLPKAAGSYKDFSKEGSSSLLDLGEVFNRFLVAFKQKPVNFSVSTTAGSSGKAQNKATGGYVGGSDRRDHVLTMLGSKEAVLNVHQQPEVQRGLAIAKSMGVGRHGSLQELFGGVRTPNYLAGGGFAGGAGVPREIMHGPNPLAAAGQTGLDQARSAGIDYLKKHMGPKPGLGHFDGLPVSDWIIPILEWARGHGWGGHVTSGYRTPAQQIAAATAYGLGHYGSAGPLGSNHVKINYPGGAVDVTAAAALAAILKGYPGKPNLVWGGPVMGDYVHFSATGHARGGFAGIPIPMSTGGPVPPKGGELVGASYYGGPSDHTSGTVGAAGVSLPGKMSFAELAMGKALGGLPFHTKLKIGYSGKSVVAEKLDIGAGGGDVGGKNRAIDLWYETAQAIGMPGLAVVKVSPAGGAAVTGGGSENVPAVFHGARTKSLSFGPVPKTLHGVKREIGQREAELRRYRAAVKAAADKPKISQALQHNVTALEGRLQQLYRQRALLRRAAAKRRITRKLGRKLAAITGYERAIEAKGRAYEIAAQTTEQIVDVEPQLPELAPSASEGERAKAEKDFVATLTGYVNTQERPAYEGVMERLADWRNTILAGEMTATRQEHGWEGGVRKTDAEIDAINAYTDKVSKDVREWRQQHPKEAFPDWLQAEVRKMHAERARLPVLRFRDHELRNVLGQARDVFWAGVKNPVKPPQPPLEGTGTFEGELQQVQGVHWPDQHGLIDKLPVARVAGQFGGLIWDTQRSISELDLKIASAANAAAGGGAGSEAESVAEMRKELEAQLARERTAAELVTASNLTEIAGFLSEFRSQLPYVGAFATGGVVPGPLGRPALATVHGGETILRGDQGGGPVVINLHGDMADLVEARAVGMVKTADRRLGRESRTLAFAPGR